MIPASPAMRLREKNQLLWVKRHCHFPCVFHFKQCWFVSALKASGDILSHLFKTEVQKADNKILIEHMHQVTLSISAIILW